MKTNSMERLEMAEGGDSYYLSELKYVEAFQKLLSSGFNIDYFGGMKDNGVYPLRRLSDEEKTLVATVIQWLGSPVGRLFLASVDKNILV